MSILYTAQSVSASNFEWTGLSMAQKTLCLYGLLMAAVLLPTYALSWVDLRTLREVGIWAKPMKFMAGTALFA
jgi:hypothetical protein